VPQQVLNHYGTGREPLPAIPVQPLTETQDTHTTRPQNRLNENVLKPPFLKPNPDLRFCPERLAGLCPPLWAYDPVQVWHRSSKTLHEPLEHNLVFGEEAISLWVNRDPPAPIVVVTQKGPFFPKTQLRAPEFVKVIVLRRDAVQGEETALLQNPIYQRRTDGISSA
jgi:hypothetical protein